MQWRGKKSSVERLKRGRRTCSGPMQTAIASMDASPCRTDASLAAMTATSCRAYASFAAMPAPTCRSDAPLVAVAAPSCRFRARLAPMGASSAPFHASIGRLHSSIGPFPGSSGGFRAPFGPFRASVGRFQAPVGSLHASPAPEAAPLRSTGAALRARRTRTPHTDAVVRTMSSSRVMTEDGNAGWRRRQRRSWTTLAFMFDFEPTEEQRALIETARRFTKERIIPIAAECDREAKFPQGGLRRGARHRPREPDAPRRVRRRGPVATSTRASSPRSWRTAARASRRA